VLDAAATGDISRLRELLDSGADPNVADPQYGNTPLSRACFTDRVDTVKFLLDRGADPNRRITYHSPVDGRTDRDVVALMFTRSFEVIRALLGAGADPNAQDATGRTPLMHAALAAPPAAVQALLDAGADPMIRNDAGECAADLVRNRIEWLKGSVSRDSAKARRRLTDLEKIYAVLTD
jgi:cytohesin